MADAPRSETTEPRPRSRPRALDPRALARAEQALQALSGEFSGWMAEETGKLEAARARVHAEGRAPDAWAELHTRAHDLKGLGATFGQPLATRVCASLCRLLDDPARRAATPLSLVDAHVDAVRALVDGPGGENSAVASACEELEACTAEVLARRGG